MTGELRVEVDGAEALSSSLAAVGGSLDDLQAAGATAGQAVRTRAQANAPVNTGALARSIRADATGTEVTVGAYVPYAAFQEYGTVNTPASPYLRPALEASTTQIVDAYADEIGKKLDSVRGA